MQLRKCYLQLRFTFLFVQCNLTRIAESANVRHPTNTPPKNPLDKKQLLGVRLFFYAQVLTSFTWFIWIFSMKSKNFVIILLAKSKCNTEQYWPLQKRNEERWVCSTKSICTLSTNANTVRHTKQEARPTYFLKLDKYSEIHFHFEVYLVKQLLEVALYFFVK